MKLSTDYLHSGIAFESVDGTQPFLCIRVEVVTTFWPDSVCRDLQERFLRLCSSPNAYSNFWFRLVVHFPRFIPVEILFKLNS